MKSKAVVILRLPEDEKRALVKLAAHERLTLTDTLRRLIRLAWAKLKKSEGNHDD